MGGLKHRRKGLYARCSRAIPLVNPTLNDLPVCRCVFDGHLHQSLGPFAMPLAVFI